MDVPDAELGTMWFCCKFEFVELFCRPDAVCESNDESQESSELKASES